MTYIILATGPHCHQHAPWCDNHSSAAQIRHGFFTAQGGVSKGSYKSLNCSFRTADTSEMVIENRRRVAAGLGFPENRLFGLQQYHSDKAILLSEHSHFKHSPDADAYVSTQIGAAISILTADCVPVLFADRANGVIGAAHAGWRGAMEGVLESTVNVMCEAGAVLSQIQPIMGPAIAKQSYQVSNDCRDTVLAMHSAAVVFFEPDPLYKQKYQFDLPAFVTWQLQRIGLQNIIDLALDTYKPINGLFSHRWATHKKLPGTGRQIGVIGLLKE